MGGAKNHYEKKGDKMKKISILIIVSLFLMSIILSGCGELGKVGEASGILTKQDGTC